MSAPQNLKYTKEHEWLLVEGTTGTIGITDYASGELGDIVFIDIDAGLKEIKSGDKFGTIEAVKTVSDLFAPCDGVVLEINSALNSSPEVVNQDPYGQGWMIKIEIGNLSQLDSLLDGAAYSALIGR